MKRLPIFLIRFGIAAIVASLFIFFLTFYPVIVVEIGYWLSKPSKDTIVAGREETTAKDHVLYPTDEEFGIVVPKIGANAKIIDNVDPYTERIYQIALTKGVAHARGTAFPGEDGNVFLFSHSSVNFYEANRYNSIFYLLSKMEAGDDVYVFYRKEKFRYKVTEKKIVDASAVSYLAKRAPKETLTLMTCWPPGTTLKRLLIIGEII